MLSSVVALDSYTWSSIFYNFSSTLHERDQLQALLWIFWTIKRPSCTVHLLFFLPTISQDDHKIDNLFSSLFEHITSFLVCHLNRLNSTYLICSHIQPSTSTRYIFEFSSYTTYTNVANLLSPFPKCLDYSSLAQLTNNSPAACVFSPEFPPAPTRL